MRECRQPRNRTVQRESYKTSRRGPALAVAPRQLSIMSARVSTQKTWTDWARSERLRQPSTMFRASWKSAGSPDFPAAIKVNSRVLEERLSSSGPLGVKKAESPLPSDAARLSGRLRLAPSLAPCVRVAARDWCRRLVSAWYACHSLAYSLSQRMKYRFSPEYSLNTTAGRVSQEAFT